VLNTKVEKETVKMMLLHPNAPSPSHMNPTTSRHFASFQARYFEES
jgi:hypothetical protein